MRKIKISLKYIYNFFSINHFIYLNDINIVYAYWTNDTCIVWENLFVGFHALFENRIEI